MSNAATYSQSNTIYTAYDGIAGTFQGAGGVGGLLATVRDDGMFFPCYDANGNVTEYVGESGAVRAHYEYSPFGEIVVQSGDLADAFLFRFSTKPYDPLTGFSLYQRRIYLPWLGCWANRDPIGERGGLDLYGFVMNNPVGRWDVLGMDVWKFAGDPEDAGYYQNYLPIWGSSKMKMSVKWEYKATHCKSKEKLQESYGPYIFTNGNGYYPLLNVETRSGDQRTAVYDSGFGTDFYGDIHCYKGEIVITIGRTGKAVLADTPPEDSSPGITQNFQHHAYKGEAGELPHSKLTITVKFDFCGRNKIYKVTSSPKIPIGEKRNQYWN